MYFIFNILRWSYYKMRVLLWWQWPIVAPSPNVCTLLTFQDYTWDCCTFLFYRTACALFIFRGTLIMLCFAVNYLSFPHTHTHTCSLPCRRNCGKEQRSGSSLVREVPVTIHILCFERGYTAGCLFRLVWTVWCDFHAVKTETRQQVIDYNSLLLHHVKLSFSR